MSVPASVTVRPARRQDAAAMQQLAQAADEPYVPRIGRRTAPMTADYTTIASAGSAWLAEQGDRLVGLLVLEPAEDHLLLENVAVAPGAQGAGVGSRLLRLAEEQAQAQGLPEVRLFTNEAMTENLDYYPRRGYREPTAAPKRATAGSTSPNLSPAAAGRRLPGSRLCESPDDVRRVRSCRTSRVRGSGGCPP